MLDADGPCRATTRRLLMAYDISRDNTFDFMPFQMPPQKCQMGIAIHATVTAFLKAILHYIFTPRTVEARAMSMYISHFTYHFYMPTA